MGTRLNAGILSLLLVTISAWGFAQTAQVRQNNFNTDRHVALDGYDPVSYFNGKPKEGKKEFSFTYNGIIYYFSSAENRSRFQKDPLTFEPAYGGWCAYAMGESGEKVKVDPETFKILYGKLYLFYNFWGNNTLNSWNKNEGKLKTVADKNWEGFLK